MVKIQKVRVSVKEDRTLVIFQLEGAEKPIFLTGKQVTAGTGLLSNFHVLRGSTLEVEFYKKDEEMLNGKCTKDETIIKEFTFELTEKLSNIAGAAAFGASMF